MKLSVLIEFECVVDVARMSVSFILVCYQIIINYHSFEINMVDFLYSTNFV